MGKILPRRKLFKSSIFTPRLDGISHIDNVRASLDTLIFSNEREVEKVLFKKRIKVVVVMTIILMIVGYFLSPKGKADVATFYPTACLGGWNNPRNAEGEPQTTRNDDVTQFTNENSAVLASSTHADMYCGSFVGAIEKDTVPKKILVSIAWSTGSDIPLEKNISSPTFSSSSMEILDTASTTQVSFTLASSTEEISTSSPSNSVSSSTDEVSTTTEEITEQATTTENATQSTNLIEKVLDKAGDVLETIFGGGDSATVPVVTTPQPEVTPIPAPSTTETPAPQSEVTPTPAPSTIETPAPAPAIEGTPSSFLQKTFMKIVGNIFESVFAEEGGDVVMESNEVVGATTSTEEITPVVSREIEQMIIEEVKKDNENTSVDTGSTSSLALSFDQASTSESTSTDYIEVATTSDTETTPSYQSQNNFLEVLYTFDGITWNSLGEVNEESIKYRTFEIPVTASTTWSDMGQLQIKVQPVQRIDATPTVYLDAIKVEVLYESPLTHTHPDFKRDTILQDETIDGVRILRIINNDTNEEEVWYMHVEEVPTATTTVEVATTTDMIATSTVSSVVDATSTTVQSNSSGTEVLASSTPRKVIRPSIPKNTWLKFNGEVVEQQGIKILLKQIEEQEEKKEFIYPDFAKDLIKKIGGSYVSATIVQIEQEGIDSLWLFDNEKNTKEKIDKDGVTTISKRYPFGIKGGSVYWLSEDETMVYRYTIDTKVIDQKEIPPHDEANGERGEVMFENSLWKVYVGADAFSFSSEETGEIFSDDNLTVGEAFRIKEKLDLMISKEKLEELNFVTEDQPQ